MVQMRSPDVVQWF